MHRLHSLHSGLHIPSHLLAARVCEVCFAVGGSIKDQGITLFARALHIWQGAFQLVINPVRFSPQSILIRILDSASTSIRMFRLVGHISNGCCPFSTCTPGPIHAFRRQFAQELGPQC